MYARRVGARRVGVRRVGVRRVGVRRVGVRRVGVGLAYACKMMIRILIYLSSHFN